MRYLLVVELERTDDVEPYRIAGEIERRADVRSVAVTPIEDGDSLCKFSTVKEEIAGFARELRPVEQAGADNPSADDGPECVCYAGWECEKHPAPVPPPREPPPALSEYEQEAHAARHAAGLEQRQRDARAKLEAFDRAGEVERARRAQIASDTAYIPTAVRYPAPPPRECHGGCSRGGEGPACGKPGCY